jgi:hypothetical protein
MTTHRDEIVVEGSWDGRTWLPYRFLWKPEVESQRIGFLLFHMPRLDWQMWFAALGDFETTPWFPLFLARLLQGEGSVTGLLDHHPFEDRRPKYVRALRYRYRFQPWDASLGWEREGLGPYSPVFTSKTSSSD